MGPFETAWALLKMGGMSPKDILSRKRAAGVVDNTPKMPDSGPKRMNDESTWALERRKEQEMADKPHSELSDGELLSRMQQYHAQYSKMKEAYPELGIPDNYLDWMFQDPEREALWNEHTSRQEQMQRFYN